MSPEYWADTVCGLPEIDSVFVEIEAVPFVSATGARVLPSTVKVTVPVGVPVPGEFGVTVAVNVTFWPKTLGFWLEATAVVVFALFTVWPFARLPPDVLKFESPVYWAVMVCGLPLTVSVLVEIVAMPFERFAGACGLPSIVNVTVPVGVPAPGAMGDTVAVNVTF